MFHRKQRHGCLNFRRQQRKQQKFQHDLTLYKKTSSEWEGCELQVLDPGGGYLASTPPRPFPSWRSRTPVCREREISWVRWALLAQTPENIWNYRIQEPALRLLGRPRRREKDFYNCVLGTWGSRRKEACLWDTWRPLTSRCCLILPHGRWERSVIGKPACYPCLGQDKRAFSWIW